MVAVCVGLTTAVVLGAWSFTTYWARLNLNNAATRADASHRLLYQSYLVGNQSLFSVKVVRLDADVPGVKVIGTNVGDKGITIARNHSQWLRLTFKVIDCQDPPIGPLPVHLRIDRWYGIQTITLQDHGTGYADVSDACQS